MRELYPEPSQRRFASRLALTSSQGTTSPASASARRRISSRLSLVETSTKGTERFSSASIRARRTSTSRLSRSTSETIKQTHRTQPYKTTEKPADTRGNTPPATNTPRHTRRASAVHHRQITPKKAGNPKNDHNHRNHDDNEHPSPRARTRANTLTNKPPPIHP